VHRDVKPQNILLDDEAGAKVTDFGIARSGTEEGLTVSGRVLGTTDYVSPEQALGHQVDGRSDLYSLGVVLYESLTGSVPFSGASQIAVAAMHVRDEIPDVQRRRPEVSAALAAVIDRATAKHLTRRYATAEEMIADLESVLAIETARTGDAGREATAVLRSMPAEVARRLPLRVRHPASIAVAAAAAVLLATAVAVFLLTRTHAGTGTIADPGGRAGEVPVRLNQNAAQQYNPFGTSPEDPTQVGLAIDSDNATSWSTSTYLTGALGKSGVGLYVDASPRVAANQALVVTPTPGFHVQIWATNRVAGYRYGTQVRPGVTPAALGWTRLATGRVGSGHTTIPLQNGTAWRYYLLWITDLGPDPGGSPRSVQVAEFVLFRGARRT
jgi:eukaryotic-like serine/threonine-protein kinase